MFKLISIYLNQWIHAKPKPLPSFVLCQDPLLGTEGWETNPFPHAFK